MHKLILGTLCNIWLSLLFLSSNAFALTKLHNNSFDWNFSPANSPALLKISPKLDLGRQVPKHIECCAGTFSISVRNKSLQQLTNGEYENHQYLLLPMIFQLRSVTVNGRLALSTSSDYSASGPIIPISESEYKDSNLKIEIQMEMPNAFVPNLWIQPTYIGTFDEVFAKRESSLIFQKYVPLFYAYILLIIAVALIVNERVNPSDNRLFKYLLHTLLWWSAFGYSLSGVLKDQFPIIGTYLHFIIRACAGLSTIRLMLLLMKIDNRKINTITSICAAVIGTGAVLSINRTYLPQFYSYLFINIVFAATTGILIKHAYKVRTSDPVVQLMAVTSTIFSIGTMFDSAKLLGHSVFDFETPLPFLNRYTVFPLLFSTIFCLIYEASKRYTAELRASVTKEVNDQVLHDLRSPAAAIRNAMHFQNSPTFVADFSGVLNSACERILEMCDSLRKNRDSSVAEVVTPTDLSCHLRQIIDEKRSELTNANISFIETDTSKKLALINRFQFQRVISNLINNSFEACPEGSLIEAGLRKDGNNLIIDITDNGHGFDPITLKTVLSRKYSFGKKEGLGFGLHYARLCIQNWSGKFEIKSKAGKTTVTIILPVFNK